MRHSTTRPEKPAKPHKDFPLFAHATGRWAKKVLGNLHYFGPWSDPDAALNKWLEQKDDLLAGRKPRPKTAGLTVMQLVNRFLTTKQLARDDGELSPRTFQGYYRTSEYLLKMFGKYRLVTDLQTEDFEKLRAEMSARLNHSSRMVQIQLIRTFFKYAFDEGLIDTPIRFGTAFRPPNAKTLQKDSAAKKEARRLTANEVRDLIDAAGVYLRAMMYLGINCGFGNNDCATLTFSALDLDGRWVNHPRPKTGVGRRAKLWPETVAAIKVAIEKRRTPKGDKHANLVFITQTGEPWVRMAKAGWTDAVTAMSRILFVKLGINAGASFYSLRRMTETIGGGCKDQVAVDVVMGHSRGDMASVYRLDIEDSRLEAVADHIHRWLFGVESRATK